MSKKTYPRCVCGFPAEFPENDPKTCGRDGCTDSPAATDHPKDFTQSFDARDWARAFVGMVRTNPSIATDESTMIGWFANALMRGFDEKRSSSMTNQIAPSLATELEQAAGYVRVRAAHDDTLRETASLLTRAAALARAAEKKADEWEAVAIEEATERFPGWVGAESAYRLCAAQLRALVSSEGKGE